MSYQHSFLISFKNIDEIEIKISNIYHYILIQPFILYTYLLFIYKKIISYQFLINFANYILIVLLENFFICFLTIRKVTYSV